MTRARLFNDEDASTGGVTWKQMLLSRGAELWAIRERGLLGVRDCGSKEEGSHQKDRQRQNRQDECQRLPKAEFGLENSCILPIDGSSRPQYSTPLNCGCLPRLVMPPVCDAVCVLSNPMDFQRLEDEYGMDKLDGGYNYHYHRQKQNRGKDTSSSVPLPLTRAVGGTWIRQRKLILEAFTGIPKQSLDVIDGICQDMKLMDEIICRNTRKDNNHKTTNELVVDLHQVVVQTSVAWVVRLFHGTESGHTECDRKPANNCFDLELACIGYWKSIRGNSKDRTKISDSKRVLSNVLKQIQQSIMREELRNANDILMNCHFSDSGIIGALCRMSVAEAHQGNDENKHQVEDVLTQDEVTENAINAMIAALDAVQSLVFWTLWNLSHNEPEETAVRDDGVDGSSETHDADDAIRKGNLNQRPSSFWYKCRQELLALDCVGSGTKQEQNDLEQLALFKRHATQGRLDATTAACEMTTLGRALVETVRVFPPVWTLPRNWPLRIKANVLSKDMDGRQTCTMSRTVVDYAIQSTKLDVPTCNGVLDRGWNPNRYSSSTSSRRFPCLHQQPIASFGLGKRHCPAGTAALYAAYKLVKHFVLSYASIQECHPDKAFKDTYLGPTLCTTGSQYFLLHPG